MGYTNYWKYREEFVGKELPEKFCKDAVNALKCVVKAGVWLSDDDNTEKCKDVSELVKPKMISFEGYESIGEPFYFSPYGRTANNTFAFCKTYGEPYDIAVKAILELALRHGIIEEWSCDDAAEKQSESDKKAQQIVDEVKAWKGEDKDKCKELKTPETFEELFKTGAVRIDLAKGTFTYVNLKTGQACVHPFRKVFEEMVEKGMDSEGSFKVLTAYRFMEFADDAKIEKDTKIFDMIKVLFVALYASAFNNYEIEKNEKSKIKKEGKKE